MKQVATPKQTAGGGYAFEDKVVGYYLAWMLTGSPPFARAHGRIDRIDCQVGVDGWLLDDLLLTLTHGGQEHRYAFSIKSNIQFSKGLAPREFVETAWSLFLNEGSRVFDRNVDFMGIICVPHPDPPKVAIQSLFRKARHQTSEQLASRIVVKGYASEEERSLFKSFNCPSELATKYGMNSQSTGEMLKRTSVVELDFENPDSDTEAMAIFFCRDLVADKTYETARRLWEAICRIAQRIRTSGGGCTREELFAEIRSHFELRDLPDFSPDWEHLQAWCDAEIEAIPDLVGGMARVDRDDAVSNALNAVHDSRFVALIGASGTGKTVIAKWATEEFSVTGHILWFKGGRLRAGYVEAFATHHGLHHPLRAVLSNGKHVSGLVIIDGAERLVEEDDFKEAILLLHLLEMDQPGSVWRILITCRAEEWERVQLELTRHFGHRMDWKPVRLSSPSFENLHPVWKTFPALRTLAVRPHLTEAMCNPKILDLLAVAIQSGHDLAGRSWVGESDMIRWYWQSIVRNGAKGAARAVLLQKIGEREADNGQFELPEGDFSTDELSLISESREVLLVDSEHGTVSFSHDLIADWARFHATISHEHELETYLKSRLSNPHWHRAIRLHGVALLDSDTTARKWQEALERIPVARDLLLEALIFAGDSQQLLERSWPVLVEKNGKLLRYLLKRFQHVATIPNPEYMTLARQMQASNIEARTWERLPLWMYWLGMLQCLANHVDEVVQYSPIETSSLARTWLRYTPRDWPGREQAAGLALAVGWKEFRTHRYSHRSEDDAQLPYKAVLEAFQDKPEEVRDLVLKAAARRESTEGDGEAFKYYKPPGTITHIDSIIYGGDRVTLEPWTDGPLYRVDESFRRACLETDALRGIMKEDPELAKEIILALLIQVRPPRMDLDYHDSMELIDREVGLEHDGLFFPRFYTRGPFLLFLRVNLEPAMETIIRLVDFATERWMEVRYEAEARNAGIDLPLTNGIKRFIGDGQVYHWYHATVGSDIVTSALMAVEKWLYVSIDNKKPIERSISLILEKAQSLAFIGILSEVGRYSPDLLAGPLRPLLLVPDTYYFETLFMIQGGHSFGTPASLFEGEWFWNMAREWDTMEHRRRRLIDIAAYLFYGHKETQQALLTARENWQEKVKEGSEQWTKHTRTLMASFDQKNWKEIRLSDGSKRLVFQEPNYLQPPPEKIERSSKHMLLLSRPMECRKMLDEKSPLPEDKIADFLDQAKALLKFEPDDPDIMQIAPPANAVCGSIAVLLLLHRQWLREHPEDESWCVNKLEEILANPPPWHQMDLPESVGNYTWEHFACDVAPILWAENPRDSKWRMIVGNLVMAKHYMATGILVNRAFENRRALGKSFWELVHFVLDWAVVRYDLEASRFSREKEEVDMSGWKRKVQRFAQGKYSSELPAWGTQSFDAGKLRWSDQSRYYGKEGKNLLYRIPKIDREQIRHTFASVFFPNQAINSEERTRFTQFWGQALITCLALTRFFEKEGNEVNPAMTKAGLPFDFDRWLLKRLSIVVSQMQPDEAPEQYWQPILNLGPRAEHWIEPFVDSWFMDAKRVTDRDRFVQYWQQMLDFCLSAQSWTAFGTPFSHNLPSLWLSLLGLPRFITSLWVEEDKEIIGAMQCYFVKIAPSVLESAHTAVRLVSWLSELAAEPVRLQMLKPLYLKGQGASDYWWKERHLTSVVARYLNVIWDKHRRDLTSDATLKRQFQELLHATAARHEPLALELQSRIASR